MFTNWKKFIRFWPENYSERNSLTTGWFCVNHNLMPEKKRQTQV